MKYTSKSVTTEKMVLANDHYVARSYNCIGLDALATDGVIPAGTVIPSNDAAAKGVLLSDVHLNDNPNGTIVVHGFIRLDRLPTTPSETASAAMKLIQFV